MTLTAQIRGSDTKIGFLTEQSYGVPTNTGGAIETPTMWGRHHQFDVTLAREIEEIFGLGQFYRTARIAKWHQVKGKLTIAPLKGSASYNFFGDTSTRGPFQYGSGFLVTSESIAQTRSSFAIEKRIYPSTLNTDCRAELYFGLFAGKSKLSCKEGGFVVYEVDVDGCDVSVGAVVVTTLAVTHSYVKPDGTASGTLTSVVNASWPAERDEAEVHANDTKLYFDLGDDGTYEYIASEAMDWSIEIDNAMDAKPGMCSSTRPHPYGFEVGEMKIKVSVTLRFENYTMYDRFLTESVFRFALGFDVNNSTAAYRRYMKFAVCRIDDGTATLVSRKGLEVKLEFTPTSITSISSTAPTT